LRALVKNEDRNSEYVLIIDSMSEYTNNVCK